MKDKDENNSTSTQLQTIFHFLRTRIATGSMVSKATGVPQKNFCRYKRDLEKAGKLAEVKKGICEVTRFRAWYVTTDERMFPAKKQLNLFQ